jgi:hypothetical protein
LNCANESTCQTHWQTGYVSPDCTGTWRAYLDCAAGLAVGDLECDGDGNLGPAFTGGGAVCFDAVVAHGACVGG